MVEIFNFLAFKQDKEGKEREKKIKESVRREKPNWDDKINMSKLTELLTLVNKLTSETIDNPNREAYQAKYDLVSFYVDAEIIGWINNFDAQEVINEPFFYSALIDVARNRGLFH